MVTASRTTASRTKSPMTDRETTMAELLTTRVCTWCDIEDPESKRKICVLVRGKKGEMHLCRRHYQQYTR